MKISDEMLSAFVNGKLAGSERQQVEMAIASDQKIARRVARQRARRSRVRAVLIDDFLPQPERTGASQPARLYPGPASVIDLAQARAELAQRRRRRPAATTSRWTSRWPAVAALAGAAVFGALLMALIGQDGITRYEDGRLIARGMLATALNAQLTGQGLPGAHILLTATYRTRNGDICRSFSVASSQPLTGTACRGHRQWQIESLNSTGNPSTQVNPRAPALAAPLGNAAEIQLRAHDWRP